MKRFFLILAIAFLYTIGYSQDCSNDFSSADLVAEEIIDLTNSGNKEALKCLFSAHKLEEISSKKDWNTYFKRGKTVFAGVSGIDEVKLGPPLDGNFAFMCKVKEEGDHVVIMLLSEKDGAYFFEDLTNVSKEDYAKLPSL